MSICPILFGFVLLLLYNTPTTMGICVHINTSPPPSNHLHVTWHFKTDTTALQNKTPNLDCCSTLGWGKGDVKQTFNGTASEPKCPDEETIA